MSAGQPVSISADDSPSILEIRLEKYTVIIPTRDRCETLGPALRTCLEQSYSNLQVIVSDNCSTDATAEVVAQHRAPNLRYLKTERRLSMADNFEFALNHVDDGFVMFIGDDDGLLPDAVSYVAQLQKSSGLLAISGSNAEYCWPNFPDTSRANSLKWQTSHQRSEIRSSRKWVNRCLSFRDVYTFEMPKLYHGFVHKNVIDRARSDGRFFHSITPDAYSAFAIAFFVDEYVYSHRPFTIGGASGRSNGVSSMDAKGTGNEAQRFHMENTIKHHPSVELCASLEVCMTEAFMKFAERFPDLTVGYSPDWDVMLHSALGNANPRTRPEIQIAVQAMADLHAVDLSAKCQQYQLTRWRRSLGHFARVLRSYFEGRRVKDASLFGVKDVQDAAHFIQRAIVAAGGAVIPKGPL